TAPRSVVRHPDRHRPRLPGAIHSPRRRVPPLPDDRRLIDQGAVPALVPADVLRSTGEGTGPPSTGRHPGEHPGAGVLPACDLRRTAGAGRRRGPGHRGRSSGPAPHRLSGRKGTLPRLLGTAGLADARSSRSRPHTSSGHKGHLYRALEGARGRRPGVIPVAVQPQFVAIMVARVVTTAHARWWL